MHLERSYPASAKYIGSPKTGEQEIFRNILFFASLVVVLRAGVVVVNPHKSSRLRMTLTFYGIIK